MTNTSPTEIDERPDLVQISYPCGYCGGEGWTAGHDSSSYDEHGEHDCSRCPEQVQCQYCHATGRVIPIDVVQAHTAQKVQEARVDELKSVICHKHGWSDSCPQLRTRLATLSTQPQEEEV